MAFLLAALLPLAAALPAASTTYPVGTTLSFQQNTYEFTNAVYLAAAIAPVGTGEGACYPHIFSTTYLSDNMDAQLLNLTTTGPTKKNGRTPVNQINIEDGCWGLDIEQGLVVARQTTEMKGWYVDENGVLGNDDAPHGFYYCPDTNGNGNIGVEDSKGTHVGEIYGVCFDFQLTAFATT